MHINYILQQKQPMKNSDNSALNVDTFVNLVINRQKGIVGVDVPDIVDDSSESKTPLNIWYERIQVRKNETERELKKEKSENTKYKLFLALIEEIINTENINMKREALVKEITKLRNWTINNAHEQFQNHYEWRETELEQKMLELRNLKKLATAQQYKQRMQNIIMQNFHMIETLRHGEYFKQFLTYLDQTKNHAHLKKQFEIWNTNTQRDIAKLTKVLTRCGKNLSDINDSQTMLNKFVIWMKNAHKINSNVPPSLDKIKHLRYMTIKNMFAMFINLYNDHVYWTYTNLHVDVHVMLDHADGQRCSVRVLHNDSCDCDCGKVNVSFDVYELKKNALAVRDLRNWMNNNELLVDMAYENTKIAHHFMVHRLVNDDSLHNQY